MAGVHVAVDFEGGPFVALLSEEGDADAGDGAFAINADADLMAAEFLDDFGDSAGGTGAQRR